MADYAIVVDLETTGLNGELDKIIEIGAIKFNLGSGEVVDQFQSFSNPSTHNLLGAGQFLSLDPAVVEITGITDEMLVGAPSNKEVVNSFFEFAQDLEIWAYNSSFDSKFLNCHTPIHRQLQDVLVIARKAFPNLVNHRLGTVATHLNLSIDGAHRAIADCIMAKEVLLHGLRKVNAQQGI
jgi:DNA polymerase III epsilon subunit family exonuclease